LPLLTVLSKDVVGSVPLADALQSAYFLASCNMPMEPPPRHGPRDTFNESGKKASMKQFCAERDKNLAKNDGSLLSVASKPSSLRAERSNPCKPYNYWIASLLRSSQ